MFSEEIEKEEKCGCGFGQGECHCEGECHCSGECDCGEDCHCGEGGERCNENCDCEEQVEICPCGDEYLQLAKRVQADFDNFRRHAGENVKKARIDGQISVIEAFLPCLDIFKEAKKSITDENVLKGVEMVENKIISSLEELGVQKITSIGEVYDPYKHNVIAVVKVDGQEDDIIVDEYQAGYTFADKVIRYAKVIVNKKEEN